MRGLFFLPRILSQLQPRPAQVAVRCFSARAHRNMNKHLSCARDECEKSQFLAGCRFRGFECVLGAVMKEQDSQAERLPNGRNALSSHSERLAGCLPRTA
jgi:hypothetical protein